MSAADCKAASRRLRQKHRHWGKAWKWARRITEAKKKK